MCGSFHLRPATTADETSLDLRELVLDVPQGSAVLLRRKVSTYFCAIACSAGVLHSTELSLVVTFESVVDEILQCDYSNQGYRTVHSCSLLSVIVRVSIVLKRTVVVDND